MLINLLERDVQRCNDPASPNYHKVTNVSAKIIDTYDSNFVPRIGEVISIGDNLAYDVVSIVYMRDSFKDGYRSQNENVLKVIVEVKLHIGKTTFNADGYSFEEDWPLITRINQTRCFNPTEKLDK